MHLGPTTSRFVTGEVVRWRSLNDLTKDHLGVVLRTFNDPELGERVLVRTKLRRPEIIRADRLNRPAFGVTLCGPGRLA